MNVNASMLTYAYIGIHTYDTMVDLLQDGPSMPSAQVRTVLLKPLIIVRHSQRNAGKINLIFSLLSPLCSVWAIPRVPREGVIPEVGSCSRGPHDHVSWLGRMWYMSMDLLRPLDWWPEGTLQCSVRCGLLR